MSAQFENIKQCITTLNLHVRGKKMKALEILGDFLFGGVPPKLSKEEIRSIMKGYEGKKGLLQSIGGENHLRKTLKKSSHFALQLVVRLLESSPQKTEFAEELKTIERTTLQQMKLDKHFKEAEQTRIPAVYIFCNYIKTLKPNIPLDFYITRKAYREKFVAWSSEAPPSQPGAEPTRWSQVYDFKNPDPLGVKPSVDLNAYSKGTQLDYLDIKSHQFKPSLFIKRVHSTTSAEELKKGLQNLLKAYNESAGNFSALIKTNAGVFSECNALLEDVRRDMEGLQKEGGLVTSARKSLSNLVDLENSILNPILDKKKDVERIRNIIKLTQKYSYLFKLPGLLESLHNRNDIDGIVELYQKHIKVIKQHANLPIFAKVSSKVDSILAGVKESIISMVNRERTPTYEAVTKAIKQMNVLDSRKNPRKIFLGQLHKKINSYIYRMWDKASNPYDIPWIIKEETGNQIGTNAFELAGSTTAMDQILEKTLERTIQNLEVFDKLATDYIAKKSNTTRRSSKHKGRPAKILKMQEETSHTLTTRLSYSLFEKNSKIREFNLQLVSEKLAVLEKYLPTPTFKEFIDLFESCVVNTVSQSLLRDARDLWKEEAWSKDYENKYGTCMPRVFETMAMKEIYRIKNILRGNNHLKHLSEGILDASLGLCIAMEKAIGNTASVLHTNVIDRILLSLSNIEFLKQTVLPRLLSSICETFNSPDLLTVYAYILDVRSTQATQQKFTQTADDFIEQLVSKKLEKVEKFLEEGLTLIDSDPYYKFYTSDETSSFKEVREYVMNILGEICIISQEMKRKCPTLRTNIIKVLVSETVKRWKDHLEILHRSLDKEIYHSWLDIEFFCAMVNLDTCPCFEVLKNWQLTLMSADSASRKYRSLPTEEAIFKEEERRKKSSIIESCRNRCRLIFTI